MGLYICVVRWVKQCNLESPKEVEPLQDQPCRSPKEIIEMRFARLLPPGGRKKETDSTDRLIGSSADLTAVELTGRRIGAGRLTKVEEGMYTDKYGAEHRVAVKQLSAGIVGFDITALELLGNELQVLDQLPRHPNIVKFYGGRVQLADGVEGSTIDAFIIEELMATSLAALIHEDGGNQPQCQATEAFSYSQWLDIFKGIVSGLQHLHANGIIHHDLKPSNILLDEDYVVKLADFGCSRTVMQTCMTANFRGTKLYMSPECLCGNFLRQEVPKEKIDVFALGVVMWECITGQTPRDPLYFSTASGVTNAAGAVGIETGTSDGGGVVYQAWRFPHLDMYPSDLGDLIWECLSSDMQQRPSCGDIAIRLAELSSSSWASTPCLPVRAGQQDMLNQDGGPATYARESWSRVEDAGA